MNLLKCLMLATATFGMALPAFPALANATTKQIELSGETIYPRKSRVSLKVVEGSVAPRIGDSIELNLYLDALSDVGCSSMGERACVRLSPIAYVRFSESEQYVPLDPLSSGEFNWFSGHSVFRHSDGYYEPTRPHKLSFRVPDGATRIEIRISYDVYPTSNCWGPDSIGELHCDLGRPSREYLADTISGTDSFVLHL